MFVNLKTCFATSNSIYEFVTSEDNPPFDSKGRTNLQVDDLAWTPNDAFLILLFNTGAIAVMPRLGSALLKIFNPTIINLDRNDTLPLTHYQEPRGFNELFLNKELAQRTRKLK